MLTGWQLTVSKGFLIPQRWVLGIMLFFAIIVAYMYRVVLSVAITAMVESEEDKQEKTIGDEKFKWDEHVQGIILSSFFWGYCISHIPGAIAVQYTGAKHILGAGVIISAALSIITPICVKYGDWPVLVTIRIIMGLAQGILFPALTALLSAWVPLEERGRIGTLSYSGVTIGTVFGNSLTGVIIYHTKDWSLPFYIFGAIGGMWYIIFCLICYSTPDNHPFISDAEKEYLDGAIAKSKQTYKIPYAKILKSCPVLALICIQFGHDWGLFAMVTDLPKYMVDVLDFNIKESGFWSSLPYIALWVISMISGFICDWTIIKGYMSITVARKFWSTIAQVGPGVFLLLASYAGLNKWLAVSFFTIGMGLMGTYYCGMRVNVLDLSPNYAGFVMALVNGIGALAGIIIPYLIGAMTPNQTLLEWRIVFWVTFGILIGTTVVYIFFGSGEVQSWNTPEETT